MFARNRKVILLLITAFALRLFLSPFGTLFLDFNSFLSWSQRLVEVGFKHFYKAWSDYLPGYLYILWFLGQVKSFIPGVPDGILYKFPSIIADLATTYLIFKISQRWVGEKIALLTATFYAFNPAVLANSTLWGQVDSVSTLAVIFAFYCLFKGQNLASAFSLAIASLTKPQSIILFPFAFLYLCRQKKITDFITYLFLFTGIFILAFIPFTFGKNLISFVFERLYTTYNQYPYVSVNAFNFWGIFGTFWVDDKRPWFLLSYRHWGTLIFGITAATLFFSLWKRWSKNKDSNFILLFSSLAPLSVAAFLFLTRVHERHNFPLFAFLSLAAAVKPKLWLIYFVYSLTYILNLRFSFVWINKNFAEIFSPRTVSFISFINLILFVFLLLSFLKTKLKIPSLIKLKAALNAFCTKEKQTPLQESKFVKKHYLKVLVGLIIFSILVRFWRLGFPQKFYFDEVYHAFTAAEMAKGNPAAWEWWNAPPKGFAFEWTHPPLAKLGMAAGILLFGETSFAWRFPGALLGVGCVLLVYLLGWQLFKNKTVAIFSASLFALDGLPLVMSRIGMNDIYFLFFALLALYLFLKGKLLLSGIALGLSLSSKWSAIYLLPIFLFWGTLQLIKVEKEERSNTLKRMFILYTIYYILIPPLVYLFSYLPFFTGGHNFSTWWELQKQMWWYHTRLKATHPFTSPWWGWPLLLRPVWLFVDYPSTSLRTSLIANIYAMGNPAIWWGGLVVLPFTLWQAIKRRDKNLGLVIFAYFAFFLPWATSPRIMFIYHYLPSIPFLCLSLGWVLGKFWGGKKIKILATSYLLLAICLFVFFYPHWTGVYVPKWLDNLYYWLSSWR